MPPRIVSLTNPRVKDLVRLNTDASARRESGLFCVESRRELDRAISRGFEVVELYACPGLLRERLDVPATAEVAEAVLRKIAYRQNPEGFVAVLRARTAAITDVPADGRELLVVCSGVEKPGNIGAILRSADAAGVSAVMIDSPAFDLFNPNCVRASTGAVFSVSIVLAGPTELLADLKRRGARLAAATPEAADSYTDADLSTPLAFVLGAEADGLDRFWREAADLTVRIPQHGTVDSLNVSVTAALLMFESARRRAARPPS